MREIKFRDWSVGKYDDTDYEVRKPSGELVAVVQNEDDANLIAAAPEMAVLIKKIPVGRIPSELRLEFRNVREKLEGDNK